LPFNFLAERTNPADILKYQSMTSQRVVDSEERSFRELLIDLSDGLTTNELNTLKFYCSDFIPTARREDIETPVQLWQAIMEKGRMSSSDTTFLQELMKTAIRRNDLLDKVIHYTNRAVRMQPQSGKLSFENIFFLLEHLASCFGLFAMGVHAMQRSLNYCPLTT